jgi:hypothetical protein
MDLAFGATEDSGSPPVAVVSDRSNGICCGLLGCFKNAAQTLKMAICALFQPLCLSMKAADTPDVATVSTDATADTTVAMRRGRGNLISNGERIRMLQALLSHSSPGKLHRGAIAAVAVEFGVSRHCVGALWKRGQENGGEYLDVSHRKSL